jgi:cell division protein ZapA
MDKQRIDVTICGQNYRLSVAPENRDSLLQAVAVVDMEMRRLPATTPPKSTECLAIRVAIRLAADLIQLRKTRDSQIPMPLPALGEPSPEPGLCCYAHHTI